MRIIYGGHWDATPFGWVSIPESLQDITKPLAIGDNQADAIFTEHCLEHLSMIDAINFFREAKRVLKPRGVIRTVAPFIDQMVKFKDDHAFSRNYARTTLQQYYPQESAELEKLGLNFVDHGKAFMFDSLLKKHNHKFVWTSKLMADVLVKLGYSQVRICMPADSEFDKRNCLERVVRGIEMTPGVDFYDPESLAVEAMK